MTNVGSVDRVIRFILGAALLGAPFLPQTAPSMAVLGMWQFVLAAVGAVLIVTALVGTCPAYRLLGVQTCSARRS